MIPKLFKANTSPRTNCSSQGQQRTARLLRRLAPCLLALCILEGALATYELRPVANTLLLLSESAFQFPPDFPGPPRDNNPSRTSPKVTPVIENFPFQAQGGEQVYFFLYKGQWYAHVSSRVGAFSRRAVLPVVCLQGVDVASSLEVLRKHPSWYSQRQIHVLSKHEVPTLGAVVFLGRLGLKGGGEGEASGSGSSPGQPQQGAHQPSATDPAAQWKVVAHDGKLALQEVDGGALWVPQGEGSASLEELARREVKAVPEKATIVRGVSGAEAKSASVNPPQGCTVSHYVNVADDAEAIAKGNTLSIALKLDSGEKVRLYPWDSRWVAHVFKHDIIVWVRAASPLSLSATVLKVYVWPSDFCTTCCPPCLVLAPPKYAANQPSATDPATQWKIVTYGRRLALQEVDGGALWVPKGSALCRGPLINPDILSVATLLPGSATSTAAAITLKAAATIGPIILMNLGRTGARLFFPQKCVYPHYVSVADDAEADADPEENPSSIALTLASGEAVWFYPWYGKVWVAYLPELDIVVWVRSKDPISVSANTLRFVELSAVYDSIDHLRIPRAIVNAVLSDPLARLVKYSKCVVVTTSEEELSKVRDQSKTPT